MTDFSTTTGCKHQFIHLSSESYYQSTGRYSWKYVKVETFFCQWCLEEKETKKEHFCGDHELYNLPDWCKLITKKIHGYE